MGFLRSFIKNHKIKKLEDLVKHNPSPEVFIRLSLLHKETGDVETAAKVAKRGQQLFPSSKEVAHAQEDLKKLELEAEKKRIHTRLESYPNPILYGRLAEIYKNEKDFEASINICNKGIANFPNYGGTYLVLGEIGIVQNNHDLALENLQKAVELDKYNYSALKLLGTLYTTIGNPDKAIENFKKILYFAPGDEEIQALIQKAEATPASKPPESKKAEETAKITKQELETYEQKEEKKRETLVFIRDGEVVSAPPNAAAPGAGSSVEERIQIIKDVPGVSGSILVDSFGLIIASDMEVGLDEQLVSAMLASIFRTTSESSEKMNLGRFEEGLIESDTDNVHVVRIEDMVLGVFTSPKTRTGLLEKKIKQFAESALDLQ